MRLMLINVPAFECRSGGIHEHFYRLNVIFDKAGVAVAGNDKNPVQNAFPFWRNRE